MPTTALRAPPRFFRPSDGPDWSHERWVGTAYAFLCTVCEPLQPAVCITFYPIYHCSLYCRAVSVTDNLCTKQGNSSIFGSKIRGL